MVLIMFTLTIKTQNLRVPISSLKLRRRDRTSVLRLRIVYHKIPKSQQKLQKIFRQIPATEWLCLMRKSTSLICPHLSARSDRNTRLHLRSVYSQHWTAFISTRWTSITALRSICARSARKRMPQAFYRLSERV